MPWVRFGPRRQLCELSLVFPTPFFWPRIQCRKRFLLAWMYSDAHGIFQSFFLSKFLLFYWFDSLFICFVEHYVSFRLLGPVSRKSRKRFVPVKPFVKLRPAYSVKLVFSYVVKGIEIKITAKFRASRRLRFEDTKRIMSPEMRPKRFGTFEKRAPGDTSQSSVLTSFRRCIDSLWCNSVLNGECCFCMDSFSVGTSHVLYIHGLQTACRSYFSG